MIADLDFDHIIRRLFNSFNYDEKIFLTDIDEIVTHHIGSLVHDKDAKDVARVLEELNVINRVNCFVKGETVYQLSMQH